MRRYLELEASVLHDHLERALDHDLAGYWEPVCSLTRDPTWTGLSPWAVTWPPVALEEVVR